MRVDTVLEADVLVVGMGLAGSQAALAAARAGARVLLAGSFHDFGGASFRGGTWGMGLVGPESEQDQEEFARSIEEVGCGMADPELVRTLVAGIPRAIRRLEGMGVRLRRPTNAGEREYIPCFDHKSRLWRGIERPSLREASGTALREAGVGILPSFELVDLACEGNRVQGALFLDKGASPARLVQARAASTVLATGGMAGLWRDSFAPSDNNAAVQGLALSYGAGLVNLEFVQMMPVMLEPRRGIVINEKALRWARLTDDGGELLGPCAQAVLDQRATHGPFTSRLRSREFDLAVSRAHNVRLRYEGLPDSLPELMQTYWDWLKGQGVGVDDELSIGLFAHASNGGVSINPDASVRGIEGLFACGECTGGMHGADRIGGLSSANCLVFGHAAGLSASAWANGHPLARAGQAAVDGRACPQAAELGEGMRALMQEGCMALRSEDCLRSTMERLLDLGERLREGLRPSTDLPEIAKAQALRGQLLAARASVLAMLLRNESRGPHYREDHPGQDPRQAHARTLTLKDLPSR